MEDRPPVSSRRGRALDEELAKLESEAKRSRAKKVTIGVVLVGLIGAGGAAALFAHSSSDAGLRKARDEAFGAVEKCMVGEGATSKEQLADRLHALRLVKGGADEAWPRRCAPLIDGAVKAQRAISAGERTKLEDELLGLKLAIDKEEGPDRDAMIQGIRFAWAEAEKEGIKLGASKSDVAAPPFAEPAVTLAALTSAKDLGTSSRVDLARGRVPSLHAGRGAMGFVVHGDGDAPSLFACPLAKGHVETCEEHAAAARHGVAFVDSSYGDGPVFLIGGVFSVDKKRALAPVCRPPCLGADVIDGKLYTVADRGDGALVARRGPDTAAEGTVFYAPGPAGEARPPEPLSADAEREPKKKKDKDAKAEEQVDTGRAFASGVAVVGSHAFAVTYSTKEGEPPNRELADIDLDAPERMVSLGRFDAPGNIVGAKSCRASSATYVVLEAGVGRAIRRFVGRRKGSEPVRFVPLVGAAARLACDEERLVYFDGGQMGTCTFNGNGPECLVAGPVPHVACSDGRSVHALVEEEGAIEWSFGSTSAPTSGMKRRLLVDLYGREEHPKFEIVCAESGTYALIGFGAGTKILSLGADGQAAPAG